MNRILLLTLVALVLAFATVGLAAADGGPHGGYTATTDACAGCHRAHTAQAPKLLTVAEQDLCMSCHGNTGNGADTNVLDGVYVERDGVTEAPAEGVGGRGLKGGGFENTLMNTAMIGGTAPGATGTSSAHHYDGSEGIIWGSGITSTTPISGATISLSCTNCHDPHGNGNYRILRPIPLESGVTDLVTVAEETDKNYTIESISGFYFGEGYEQARAVGFAIVPIRQEYQDISDWCTQCHTRYLADLDSGNTDSGDAIFKYRHMAGSDSYADDTGFSGCSKCHSGGVPIITYNPDYWNHNVECMTCHVAHGTSALMVQSGEQTDYAGRVEWPGDPLFSGPGDDSRSSLLRTDGRGVCQGCHNKPGETFDPFE
jgi:predicted CXXCH cytochrome family protein